MTTRLAIATELVFSRDHVRARSASQLYSSVRAGSLIRVHPGVYLDSRRWQTLEVEDRQLVTTLAAASRYPDVGPFSHLSAAAIHGLPIVNATPGRAEITMGPTSGGRSRTGIIRHASSRPVQSLAFDGLRVTSIERTIIDLALAYRVSTAVAALDFALHRELVDLDLLAAEVELLGARRGRARVARVLEFGDARAETPGESMSRVAIDVLGFDPPDLQHEFFDDDGFVARSDFAWLLAGRWHAGEFDGFGKYLRHAPEGDPAQAVIVEKLREDRLRRTDVGMSRWGWTEARALRRLESILSRAGIPRRRRFSPTPPEYDRRW